MIHSNPDSILEKLDHLIIDLLIHEPFFGRVLAKTVKVVDSNFFGISLISVNQETVRLHVNPEYWNNHLKAENEKETIQLRKTELKRQVIHFIFNHDLQFHDFKNKDLFMISAKLTANQYLNDDEKSQILLLPENYPDFNLSPLKKVSYYYQSISKKLSINKLEEIFYFDFRYFKDNKFWGNSNQNKSDIELESYFRKQFILSSFHSDLSKNSTSPLFPFLDQLKNGIQPAINWRKVLRLFYNNSNRTKLTNTIHRSSKRFGTFPGVRIRKQSRILVAIDISGSITQDALKLFFNEVDQIWKLGSVIEIVECDTIIHRKYTYKGTPPREVSGRGNTDFNEPIRFSNEVFHPDALIYFTDGFGPRPRIKSLKPILWVIHEHGIKKHSKNWNDLPGRKVKMNT